MPILSGFQIGNVQPRDGPGTQAGWPIPHRFENRRESSGICQPRTAAGSVFPGVPAPSRPPPSGGSLAGPAESHPETLEGET